MKKEMNEEDLFVQWYAINCLLRAMNEAVVLLEEADLFSDDAAEHDVAAYAEMQDFDNKDAANICSCLKKAKERLQHEIDILNGKDDGLIFYE